MVILTPVRTRPLAKRLLNQCTCNIPPLRSSLRAHHQYATSTAKPALAKRGNKPSHTRPFSIIHTHSEESQPRIAKVPDRSIVSVTGRDTVKLLQGLISNNVQPSRSKDQIIYCAFLNPSGRMLSSAFLYSPKEDCILIDVDSNVSSNLLSFIKRFKLRSKVVLEDVSERYQVWARWGSQAKVSEPPQELSSSNIVASGRDARTPLMGYRFLTESTSQEQSHGLLQNASASDNYTIHRMLQGVPDGVNDIWENQSLPLEANVDFMNGVDFRKGCYVGQELTARTHHTGVVRKRVIPIQFYAAGSSPPDVLQVDTSFSLQSPERGADVRSIPIGEEGARGKSTGKYLSGIHNIGLALLRLEQVHRWNSELLIKVKAGSDDSDLYIRPWIPHWWPEEAKIQQ